VVVDTEAVANRNPAEQNTKGCVERHGLLAFFEVMIVESEARSADIRWPGLKAWVWSLEDGTKPQLASRAITVTSVDSSTR
jgi:hypothetical protein